MKKKWFCIYMFIRKMSKYAVFIANERMKCRMNGFGSHDG